MISTLTVALYTCLLIVASLLPRAPVGILQNWFIHADKLAHCTAYAVYMCLLVGRFARQSQATTRRLVLLLGYCIAFGVLMEVLQATLQPGVRFFSYLDMMANATGALLVAVVFKHRSQITRSQEL